MQGSVSDVNPRIYFMSSDKHPLLLHLHGINGGNFQKWQRKTPSRESNRLSTLDACE